MTSRRPAVTPARERGAAIVEFALVLVILLMLIFGTIEFGRAIFQWSSAVDATRRGARAAAILAKDTPVATIRQYMNLDLPGLKDAVVTVEYSADGNFPGACEGRGSCLFVRVSIAYEFHPLMPYVPAPIPMPPFSTTLPVEALGAT